VLVSFEYLTLFNNNDNRYYPLNEMDSINDQISKILRDYIFTCSTRRMLRASLEWQKDGNVRSYFFDYQTEWVDMKIGGSYHTAELYFVFNNSFPVGLHKFSDKDLEVVSLVQDYWVNFARNEVLNGWPNFDDADSLLWFNRNGTGEVSSYNDIEGGVVKERCDYLDGLFGY